MSNEPITFNDLPQIIAELRDEVSGMKAFVRPRQPSCPNQIHG